MNQWKAVPVAVCMVGALLAGGCAAMAGGAAGGAAGYEYSNKRALDQLDEDYKAGRISKEEYMQRKEEIGERSVIE